MLEDGLISGRFCRQARVVAILTNILKTQRPRVFAISSHSREYFFTMCTSRGAQLPGTSPPPSSSQNLGCKMNGSDLSESFSSCAARSWHITRTHSSTCFLLRSATQPAMRDQQEPCCCRAITLKGRRGAIMSRTLHASRFRGTLPLPSRGTACLENGGKREPISRFRRSGKK